ncbi:MAG: undecaprenyl/decaprenyl-phosphate alpha-N-acetylglucosaminyl 1-phosphate transferase [Candidatus Doudnabacteria bacterium]|nr:undecaprenyl/decaprenyl-phosphate alpha-N-acetylglucosaminyl 1-phosphate transferase [Candidatus Doudnabacteria bacterium]
MNISFFILAISILIVMVMGYPAVLLAKRLNLMDVPGSAPHKVHAVPTPLAGGILLIFTLFTLILIFHKWLTHEIYIVFAGAGLIFIFGLWDDYKGLSAWPKLAGQLIAACVLILSGVQVRFLTVLFEAWHISPLIAQLLNIAITLFWLIGITNAMNMIDSMDGIVAGLGGIAFACFLGAATLAGQTALSIWSAGMVGICIGLYFWNKTSFNKLFLGDSGAQTIGFLLASFGIMYNPLNRSPESSWIVPIMLLGTPIFDTTLVVFSRLRRRQVVGSGRRDHTYHRLIALGLSPGFAVLITHLVAFIISFLAFLTLYLPPFVAMLFFLLTIVLGGIGLLWLERKPSLDTELEGKNG